MDDPNPTQPGTGPSEQPSRDFIPLEPEPTPRPASAPAPRPALAEESIILNCPNCGRPLPPDAVVCMKCGYDLKTNRVASTHVGEDEVEPTGAARPEFIKPAPGHTQILLFLGGALACAALVAAGFNANRYDAGFGLIAAMVLFRIYQLVALSIVGVLAVGAAAWINRSRFTSAELVAARMLVVVAGSLLVTSLWIPGFPEWLGRGLLAIASLGVYVLLVKITFRKSWEVSALILGAHALIWGFLALGMWLAAWVGSFTPATSPP